MKPLVRSNRRLRLGDLVASQVYASTQDTPNILFLPAAPVRVRWVQFPLCKKHKLQFGDLWFN